MPVTGKGDDKAAGNDPALSPSLDSRFPPPSRDQQPLMFAEHTPMGRVERVAARMRRHRLTDRARFGDRLLAEKTGRSCLKSPGGAWHSSSRPVACAYCSRTGHLPIRPSPHGSAAWAGICVVSPHFTGFFSDRESQESELGASEPRKPRSAEHAGRPSSALWPGGILPTRIDFWSCADEGSPPASDAFVYSSIRVMVLPFPWSSTGPTERIVQLRTRSSKSSFAEV